jgi:hypothetical protein
MGGTLHLPFAILLRSLRLRLNGFDGMEAQIATLLIGDASLQCWMHPLERASAKGRVVALVHQQSLAASLNSMVILRDPSAAGAAAPTGSR